LQIIAARGRDRRVLTAAAQFETILDQSGLWNGLSLQSA
jgi:Asp-tRNA(Asn)/Glu-tRNA(Gln) amidotransferase A subunit family amidase